MRLRLKGEENNMGSIRIESKSQPMEGAEDKLGEIRMHLEVSDMSPAETMAALLNAYKDVYDKYAIEHPHPCNNEFCNYALLFTPVYEALVKHGSVYNKLIDNVTDESKYNN